MRHAFAVQAFHAVLCAGILSFGLPSAADAAFTSCTFVSTTPMAFGNYNVYSATAVTSTASVIVNCAGPNSNVNAILSKGASGSYGTRTMKNGTNALSYNIYLDTGYTAIFGDGTGGSTALSGTLTGGTNYNQPFYGKVPALQDVAVGAYADSLVLTLTY